MLHPLMTQTLRSHTAERGMNLQDTYKQNIYIYDQFMILYCNISSLIQMSLLFSFVDGQ